MSLTITIQNDGTGTDDAANYDVRVHVNNHEIDRFRVHAHDRADGWKALLMRAATAAQGDMESEQC